MALISDLVSAIAEVEGIPEATAQLIARYTREAGHLSQGARGRNAPRATVTDAANLLIALNAGGCIAREAADAVEPFRALIAHAPHHRREPVPGVGIEIIGIEDPSLKFLDRHGATFGEILESVIERAIGGELEHLMMSHALAQVHPQIIEEARAKYGEDDKRNIALAIRKACRGLLSVGVASFSIEFHRPRPFAQIVIDRIAGSGPHRDLIARVPFILTAEEIMKPKQRTFGGSDGDRSERTVVGYRTLMKIGEVLMPA